MKNARRECRISLALGLHPEEVHDDWSDELDRMKPLLDEHAWVAIGEVGIDLYWDKTFRRQQMQALECQLGWCVDRKLPFIIHCREALDEVLDVLRQFTGQMPKGVFHCFTATASDVDRIRQVDDFYFGIGGVLTFKTSAPPEVLPVIGLDRILLETDAPSEPGERLQLDAWQAQLGRTLAAIEQLRDEDLADLVHESSLQVLGLR